MAGNHVTDTSLSGYVSCGADMETRSQVTKTREEKEDHSDDLGNTSTVLLSGSGVSEEDHRRPPTSSSHPSIRVSRPRLRLFAFLAFSTLLLVTMVVGMSRLRVKPTVHVLFPSSSSIRKVRMFTDYPDLAKLSKKHSSLSLVSRLQLLDAKQCQDNPGNCKVSVVCDSSQSVNCRCRTGYYFKHWKCLACSSRCPANHYLATPCNHDEDTVCKPCTVCGMTQYVAAPCNTHRDTICMDVSFPVGVLPMNKSNLHDDGITISVSHSRNVFLERLIDMQLLETPMYVTNNQQILDFVWERPSGMDISVSVTGVYLIPTYRDLDAVDDTQLFQRLMEPSKDAKDHYGDVQHKYCRHPVPDYYSLQLEVISDRQASAQVVRCDSQDPSIPACPAHVKDGDRYLKWDINKPCLKYSTSKLTSLTDGYNSVVCTEETQLLLDIFKRIRPTTQEWMFPSDECEEHRRKCQECVRTSDCPNNNRTALFGDETQCCGIPCFSTTSCQKAYSTACPPPKVECAMGEVDIFSLFPVFNSMDKEFSCRLKYAPPRFLYNVSYSIQIPSVDYNSTEKYFYVEAKSRQQHQGQISKFDFINIIHKTRIPIEEEIILQGNHRELSPYRHSLMKPFNIRQLKKPSHLAEVKNYQLDNGGYTTYIQFDQPFLYSSMSWYREGCMKNMSQIHPNQTIYRENAIPVEAKQGFQKSAFGAEPTRHPEFIYQLYRRKKQPLIRFVAKKGSSVLSHLQDRDIKGNLVPNSLYGRVTWHYKTETWKLVFSGTQDKCPTIISLKIFTQLMTGCAGHFDLLINCPNDFTVTFNFSTTVSDLPDIFVLQINDSLTSHHMVLSSMYAPVHVDEGTPKNQARAERQLSSEDDRRKNFTALWLPVFFILCISFVAFFAIVIVYHVVNTKARIPESSMGDATPEPETVALNNHGEKQSQATTVTLQPPKAKLSLYVFTALYLLYSFVFTFSLTFLIVYMTHASFWGTAAHPKPSGTDLQLNVNKSIQEIKDHESTERERLFSTFRARRGACMRHLEQENQKLLHEYQETTQKQMDAIFMENGTLHVLSNKIQKQNVSAYMTQIADFVSDCNKTVHSIVHRFEANYFDFLKKTVSNEWLRVPKQIFLVQDGGDPNRKFLSSTQIKQFASWLEIDKVEELLAVKDNVAHRLSQVPLPTVSAVDVTFPSVTPHLDNGFPDFGSRPQEFTMSVIKSAPSYNESASVEGAPAFTGLRNRGVDVARFPRSAGETEFDFGFSGYLKQNLDHMTDAQILERDRRDETPQDFDAGNDSKKNNEEPKSSEHLIYDAPYRLKAKEVAKKNTNVYSSSDPDTKADGDIISHDNLDVFLADDPSLEPTDSASSLDSSPYALPQTSSPSDDSNKGVDNTYLYILIGVFLLLDFVLFMYRLSWLCNQLYAAKHGYADRIPTDDACKQVLEIQTAYHLPAFDNSLETSGGYYVDGKDQLYVTESEREGEMTFLQSFPKSKDDFLQKILHEKLNQVEERRLRDMRRCFLWRWCANLRAVVQRLFLSQLAWQTTVTFMAIIFICIFIYCVEFWLTSENFRTLVGGQSATSDVQWQLDTSSRYLHSLAYQLTTELGRMRVLCEMEVNTLTEGFFSTLNMQTTAFTNSLQRLCMEAQEKDCDKYTAFQTAGGRMVGCNFLPLQALTFQDLSLSRIENLVSGEVMPFLEVSRKVLATSSVVVILMLCARLLCQAGATTLRHYFLLTGRLPRVKVYQAEEQSQTLKNGRGPNCNTAMQRSQSWVDSCESGVYVGEGEEANANKEEIPKLV